MARDWVEWHRAYDDPSSSLSARLSQVSRLIRCTLDDSVPGTIRVLSLCAGDARDLALAAAGHARAGDLTGAAVELDARLAAAARTNLVTAGASIDVIEGDAGATETFHHVLPVDVLLLCGVFGNCALDDIATTVAAVPAMTTPGASIIWTRHRRPPDATPYVRQCFTDAGCTEVEFVAPGDDMFAVGRARSPRSGSGAHMPARLFTFLDHAW